MSRLIRVKHHRKPFGKQCPHCGRSATVTAVRKTSDGMTMPVRFCVEHFAEAVRRCAA